MHEMSITRSIVAIVAERADGKPVRRVLVEIGKMSAIMPDAVQFCFDICAAGTVLEGAVLEVNETSGLGTCRECSNSFELMTFIDPCPACGSIEITRKGGDDLMIKEFEFDVPQDLKEAV